MLPEFGHFALILALTLAGLQSMYFFLHSTRIIKQFNLHSWNLIRPLTLGQVFCVVVGCVILITCFLTDDFSVQYVAQHSNSALPIYYKFTALWGAHEGSLLLWIVILNFWQFGVFAASKKWDHEFSDTLLVILGWINFGFLLLLLAWSNPFLRTLPDLPVDGADLNPLLQDFGMIIHPPVLYTGYVGTCVGFAFAVAGLLQHKLDSVWLTRLRPWVLLAWACLTLGIALGSWWAYYELGWGGWWFWDPVENASLMPWLTSTALIHCIILAQKQSKFTPLVLFLAIITFALSLLGTFLVRSGSITSVHAFTADATRGIYILQFLLITIGGGLLVYVWKIRQIKFSGTAEKSFMSKMLLLNNLLLLLATATVLLGTLYPMLYEAMFEHKISVGYPYFNAVFVPLMLIILSVLLMASVPQRKPLSIIIIISAVAASAFLALWFGAVQIKALVGICFAVAIILSTLYTWHKSGRSKTSMLLAHVGLALTIIGISVTSVYEVERDMQLSLGDQVELADFKIKFADLNIIDGANFISYQGKFIINQDKMKPRLAYPEKRVYIAQGLALTETAIIPGFWHDIYIALGQEIMPKTWSVRIYYKPFVRWIWLGAIFMTIAGIFAISLPRRLTNSV